MSAAAPTENSGKMRDCSAHIVLCSLPSVPPDCQAPPGGFQEDKGKGRTGHKEKGGEQRAWDGWPVPVGTGRLMRGSCCGTAGTGQPERDSQYEIAGSSRVCRVCRAKYSPFTFLFDKLFTRCDACGLLLRQSEAQWHMLDGYERPYCDECYLETWGYQN